MATTALISPPDVPRTKERRLLSVRPRLGNSWQDLSWRLKVRTPVPREPLDILPNAAKRPGQTRARRTANA